MLKYVKPEMQSMTDTEIQELIFANASCPNCYNCGTYNSCRN